MDLNDLNTGVYSRLVDEFSRYRVDNLKGITPGKFEDTLKNWLGKKNHVVEGYSKYELQMQRDLSITFHWGHDHDFGTFKLAGRMQNRHLIHVERFHTLFNHTIDSYKDKKVIDIGCWTGGTSLLLAALGAKVVAVEEVKKYANVVRFLSKKFNVADRIKTIHHSLYGLRKKYRNFFDIVFFPGVIYHISDPVLALRILFNSLNIGGVILIESAGIEDERSYCQFGRGRIRSRPEEKSSLNRPGWNWFTPSPIALHCMLEEAGFDDVSVHWQAEGKRIYGIGYKRERAAICRAGISVPEIR